MNNIQRQRILSPLPVLLIFTILIYHDILSLSSTVDALCCGVAAISNSRIEIMTFFLKEMEADFISSLFRFLVLHSMPDMI